MIRWYALTYTVRLDVCVQIFKMTRNAQFTEEKWEEMRPWLYQKYIHEQLPAGVVAKGVLEQFGYHMTERQLKNRMTHKWHVRKKIEGKMYYAMSCVMKAKGNHVAFNVALAHKVSNKPVSQITKQVNRQNIQELKKMNRDGKGFEENAKTRMDFRQAMAYLRDKDVAILGLGSNPYAEIADVPAIADESDEANDNDAGSPGDTSSDMEENPDSPVQSRQVCYPKAQLGPWYMPREDYSDSFGWWIAHQTSLITAQKNRPYSLQRSELRDLAEIYFEPQNDPVDPMSKMFARMAISLEPQDPSRRLFGEFLGCDLGTVSRQWRWDKRTDKLIVEFANYYIQQCLSNHTDLDRFDHRDRVAARQNLSELFHARTGELLQALWWIMSIVSTHYKAHQTEGLFQDIIACIEASNNDYARAMRPMFEVARRANAEYVEAIDTQLDYQRSLPDASLEFEFRRNIEYLREIRMDQTGDFVVMHMFLAWHLCTSGRPLEGASVVTSPGCLQLGERVLGSHNLVVLNCKAIAARCYHQQDNRLAMNYMNEALFGLKDCTKPLWPVRNVLKRQHAAICFAHGERLNGFQALKEVVDFRSQAFGPESYAVQTIIREMNSVARDDQERHFAQEVEQNIRSKYVALREPR